MAGAGVMDSVNNLHLVAAPPLIVTCSFCNQQHDYDALAMAMALNGLPWLVRTLNDCIQCISRVINKRLSYTIGDLSARDRLIKEIRKYAKTADITYVTNTGTCAIVLQKNVPDGAPMEIRIYG